MDELKKDNTVSPEEVEEKAEETVEETKEAETENAAQNDAPTEEVTTPSEEAETINSEEEVEEAPEKDAEATESEEKTETETPVSKKEPEVILKKKKLNKVSIIVIAACAAIVIACLLFVGIKEGWFKAKAKNAMDPIDYSVIEVDKTKVEVTDDIVDSYIQSVLQSEATTTEVTSGTVQNGDVVNIDYVGTLDSTGEAFDGGTASGTDLTIGSGTMIDGFESGIVGAQIGSTVDVHVTFPDDYTSEDLAGQPATFAITVNYVSKTEVPELTDEFAKTYSAARLETPLNTAAELKEYFRNYIYKYYLHDAMFSSLQEKQNVTSYSEEDMEKLKAYSAESLNYYASSYGYDADSYASMYGYDSAEAYTEDEAKYYLDIIILVDDIFKTQNLSYTEEELDASIEDYMRKNGYSDVYSLEEFKEKSGETWLYLYTNLEFKYNLALESLEPNVVLVEPEDETESAETETAETEAETTAAE